MRDTPTSYCYDHPHPAVTADAVILSRAGERFRVLLVRRSQEPFAGRWALPGGFVNIDEDLEHAAQRELAEETGVEGLALTQLGAFGKPGRDPRERVVSVAFYALISGDPPAPAAGTDASAAGWFDVATLPPLAFDHAEIIAAAVARIS